MELPGYRPPHGLDLREAAQAARIPVPAAESLTPQTVNTWRGRMVNEHESAFVFEGLAVQLAEAGFPDELVRTCLAFAAEERRHGELCGAVVESYGAAARAEVPAYPAYPAHADASRVEACFRNVLSICCLSETVAVALIGAERLEMPESPLRELLSRIYADEVGHCHFGWRFLETYAATLDDATRQRLGDYLAVAFAHLEKHELGHLPEHVRPPAFAAAFGLCSGADARELFYDTVTDVIVPGIEKHGIPAASAWERRAHSAA